MSDQTYFVKIRGRVVGPFPPARLTQMVQRGQLSRVHLISTDNSHWERASEFPQFFEVDAIPDRTGSSTSAEADSANTFAESHQTPEEPRDSNHHQPTAGATQWHYAINDQTTGPVSQDAIVGLIQRRELSADDMVWCSRLLEWTPVDHVPELARFLNDSTSIITGGNTGPGTRSSGTKQQQAHSGGDRGDLGPLIPLLRSSIPWVYFICGFLFLVSLALFLQFLTGLIIGGREQNGFLVFVGITSFVQMAITISAGVFLLRHASATNRFVLTGRPEVLIESLQWLNRFWLLISIVLIVWIVFVLTAVILIYSMDVQLGGSSFN